MTATANFGVPLAFAGLFAPAVPSVRLFALFALIERRVCGRASRKSEHAAN